MVETSEQVKGEIWSASKELSKRVKKLRDEFFSFYDRDYFRNEVKGYSTGTDWDIVYSAHQWGVVPEIYPLFGAFEDSLAAGAQIVKIPDDFWEHSIVMRRAIFFKEVIKKYLPVKILDGELIVGSYFNTALSKCLNKKETKEWLKLEKEWMKQANFIHFNGVGNAGAVPGHIIPNYPKVLKLGFKGLKAEFEQMIKETNDPEKIDFLKALIMSCDTVKIFSERYAEEARRLTEKENDNKRKQETTGNY